MKASKMVAVALLWAARAAMATEQDLLSLVDLQNARGLWSMIGGELWTGGRGLGADPAKLEIGYHPPAEYDLNMDMTIDRADNISFAIPYQGLPVCVIFASYQRWSGFSSLDETGPIYRMVDQPLSPGDYRVQIKVRAERIDVFMDNSFFMGYGGSANDILHTGWEAANEDPLNVGIISYGSIVTFHEMTVVPEPATLSLLALGGLALIRRRKA